MGRHMEHIRIEFSRFSAFYSPLILTMAGGFLDREGPVGISGRLLIALGGGLIALPATEVIDINVGQMTLFIAGAIAAILGVLMSRATYSETSSIADA